MALIQPERRFGKDRTMVCLMTPKLISACFRLPRERCSRASLGVAYRRARKVDNKIRTDMCFPAGFMDVVSLEKTNQHFRLLYDTKGRFVVHQVSRHLLQAWK